MLADRLPTGSHRVRAHPPGTTQGRWGWWRSAPPPGMQHRQEPDVRAHIVRIAGHGQEGLSHGLKEEVVDHPWVVEREWAKGMRESKHHMDVGHVEQLHFAGREPGGLCPPGDTSGNGDCHRSQTPPAKPVA